MGTSKGTVGPYRVEGAELIDGLSDAMSEPLRHLVIRSEGERWVALVEAEDAEGEATAEFIVTACNAHDALVAALESILSDAERAKDQPKRQTGALFDIADTARTALALAGGAK